MQGLWLGGNLLPRLPPTLGGLSALTSLSAPGNVLTELPASLGALSALQTLALAGNALTALPAALTRLGARARACRWVPLGLPAKARACSRPVAPPAAHAIVRCRSGAAAGAAKCPGHWGLRPWQAARAMESMSACAGSLRKLELHGNAVAALPEGMGALTALTQLALQGNALTELPEDFSCLKARPPGQAVPPAAEQPPASPDSNWPARCANKHVLRATGSLLHWLHGGVVFGLACSAARQLCAAACPASQGCSEGHQSQQLQQPLRLLGARGSARQARVAGIAGSAAARARGRRWRTSTWRTMR